MLTSYRSLRLDTEARLTSAKPGGTCTSASAPDGDKDVSSVAPNFENKAIAEKIAFQLGCSYEQGVALLRDASNFLWMASKSDKVFVPSPIIDEAWHVFVLFTQEYYNFCDKYCGGYVHHAPHTGPEMRMTVDYVRPTVDMLYDQFGSKPNDNWDYISVKDWMSENRIAA
jgi:hypothetical protein